MLDRDAHRSLLTLSKQNADTVARHLVMAGLLLDTEPEMAYEHARAAAWGAGRVSAAREALALTAYATGRFDEALKEIRTVRRLSGRDEHRAMEADSQRGLGRPARALEVVAQTDVSMLDEHDMVELMLVASGARADLGEHEVGLVLLDHPRLRAVRDFGLRRRIDEVRADRLDELGRTDEAAAIRASLPEDQAALDEPYVVVDLDATEEGDRVRGRDRVQEREQMQEGDRVQERQAGVGEGDGSPAEELALDVGEPAPIDQEDGDR